MNKTLAIQALQIKLDNVFLVLSRKPGMPEWIATRTYIYRIDPDGKINYIMPAEKYFKQKEPE